MGCNANLYCGIHCTQNCLEIQTVLWHVIHVSSNCSIVCFSQSWYDDSPVYCFRIGHDRIPSYHLSNIITFQSESNKLNVALKPIICIWHIPGSNLCQDADFWLFVIFLSLCSWTPEQYLKLDYDASFHMLSFNHSLIIIVIVVMVFDATAQIFRSSLRRPESSFKVVEVGFFLTKWRCWSTIFCQSTSILFIVSTLVHMLVYHNLHPKVPAQQAPLPRHSVSSRVCLC
jgi:hypothetical protein